MRDFKPQSVETIIVAPSNRKLDWVGLCPFLHDREGQIQSKELGLAW